MMGVYLGPLETLNISFSDYVKKQQLKKSAHMKNGVIDYAFNLDYELREKLNKIPGFVSFSKKVMITEVSKQMQLVNMEGLAVTPNQYSKIYNIGAECAKRLGIGIPNIYIINDTVMNAYTIAADDISPIIVLHSGLLERMTLGELKCVIAHECGHIQNNHAIYKVPISLLLNSAGSFSAIFSVANTVLMQLWTRAGEITADRAGMICADDFNDAFNVNVKLMSGGALNNANDAINIEELRKQLEQSLHNPAKLYEAFYDHPSSLRRIFANFEFEKCEVLYAWRPDLRKDDDKLLSIDEVNKKCQSLVNIIDNKGVK